MSAPPAAEGLVPFTDPTTLPPSEAAVIAPFQRFLTCLTSRNIEMMKASCLPSATITSLRNGQIRYLTIQQFIDLLSTSTAEIEERIYTPHIKIDEDLAIIWCRYDVIIKGEVHHWGTNAVQLLKQQGSDWLIASAADNCRQDGQYAVPK